MKKLKFILMGILIMAPLSAIPVLASSDTIAPSVPSNLMATLNPDNQVVLSWNASTDNVGIAAYKIKRNGSTLDTSIITSYIDTNVVPGTRYTYTVLAYDAAYNSSIATHEVSVTTLPNPDTIVPSTPINLQAKNISPTQINLNWLAASDNVKVTGYNIYQNSILIGNSTKPFFNIAGLTPATSFNYSVRAYDAAGNVSAQSVSISATTLILDVTMPTAPTGLVVTMNKHNKLVLTWNAATDNVGIKGYTIYRNGVILKNSNTTKIQDKKLMPSTTYIYSVLAYDAAGNKSVLSNTVSITTPAKPVLNNHKNDNKDNGKDEQGQNGQNNGNHFGENKSK